MQLTGEITHEQYLYLHENKNLYNLIIQIYKCITNNFFACSSVVIIIASHVAKYNNISKNWQNIIKINWIIATILCIQMIATESLYHDYMKKVLFNFLLWHQF